MSFILPFDSAFFAPDNHPVSENSPLDPPDKPSSKTSSKELFRVSVMILMLEAEAKEMQNACKSRMKEEEENIQYLKKAYQQWLDDSSCYDEMKSRLELLKHSSEGFGGNGSQEIFPQEIVSWVQQQWILLNSFEGQLQSLKAACENDQKLYKKWKARYEDNEANLDKWDKLMRGEGDPDGKHYEEAIGYYYYYKYKGQLFINQKFEKYQNDFSTDLTQIAIKESSCMGSMKAAAGQGGVEALKNMGIYHSEEVHFEAMVEKVQSDSKALGEFMKALSKNRE